jgi:hypothetical protein
MSSHRIRNDRNSLNKTAAAPGPPSHDEIARRAYQLFEERGREPGREWEDWFRAEREYEEG